VISKRRKKISAFAGANPVLFLPAGNCEDLGAEDLGAEDLGAKDLGAEDLGAFASELTTMRVLPLAWLQAD
jgi:hypothetical protein